MNVAVEKLLKPGPDARQVVAKGEKPRKPSPKVREAIKLMQSGEAKSITDAAKQVKLSRPYLSETLHEPHVQQYILAQTVGEMTVALLRSGPRARDLVDAVSEHVSMDAVKHVQGVAGIHAHDPRGPLVNLALSVTTPGYVIDLSGGGGADDGARPAPPSRDARLLIDVTPQPIDNAGRLVVAPQKTDLELAREQWEEDRRRMSPDIGANIKPV